MLSCSPLVMPKGWGQKALVNTNVKHLIPLQRQDLFWLCQVWLILCESSFNLLVTAWLFYQLHGCTYRVMYYLPSFPLTILINSGSQCIQSYSGYLFVLFSIAFKLTDRATPSRKKSSNQRSVSFIVNYIICEAPMCNQKVKNKHCESYCYLYIKNKHRDTRPTHYFLTVCDVICMYTVLCIHILYPETIRHCRGILS